MIYASQKKQTQKVLEKTLEPNFYKVYKKNPIDISTFIARYSKIKEQVILDEINNLISEELLLKTGKILKSNE